VPRGTTTTLAFNSSLAIAKDYSVSTTLIDTNPARARALLLAAIPLDQVIPALRTNPFNNNIQLLTPYCWVDFSRSFELAHSAIRQQRCLRSDIDNGAVYLDALLRNTPVADLMSSQYFGFLNYSVFAAVRATAQGQAWLATTLSHSFLDPGLEIQAWQQAGIVRWQSQLNNGLTRGIDETIVIENALGLRTTITVNNVGFVPMGNVALWTTRKSYVGFASEILYCTQYIKCSLVRSAPNFIQTMGVNWDTYVVIGPKRTPAIDLVRKYIGPYGNIDMRFVPIPTSLLTQVSAFVNTYYATLQQSVPATQLSYSQFTAVAADAVPPLWQSAGMSYFGGNPMCIFGVAQPYVQASFGLYDQCGTQPPHIITLGKDSAVFASTMMGGMNAAMVQAIAAMCATTQPNCFQALQVATSLYSTIWPNGFPSASTQSTVWSDIVALNTTLIQFATQNTTEILLTQPMVASPTDAWSFFGWITMFEWVEGVREVYTFESDVGSITLITAPNTMSPLSSNPLELPQSACYYVWYITVYITFVLLGIAVLIFLCGFWIKFQMHGRKLFQFNRVVGSIWIGRPFLLVRGMTAVVVLSTANLLFVAPGGFSQLQLQHRPWFEILVLAGETTWVSYVLVDAILPLTLNTAHVYAPVSSLVSWIGMVILEFSNPYNASPIIQTQCTVLALDRQLQCTSGTLAIGSSSRAGVICLIQILPILLAYIITRIYIKFGSSKHRIVHLQYHLVVPVASQAFLEPNESNNVIMDKVSCLMSGMVPLRRSIFDIKLWSIISLKHFSDSSFTFEKPNFRHESTSEKTTQFVAEKQKHLYRFRSFLGLAYIVATVIGSYLYIILTQSTMSNDLWWASFNNTGAQSYISNWFTVYLQRTNALLPTQIDNPKYAEDIILFNQTATLIPVPQLYASNLQSEVQTISNVIQGLRKMDGCIVPWIFTAYCFVDFNRQWEMANSADRQNRCRATETTNGAVYLEAVLRNADWLGLNKYWGSALNTAVFSYLNTFSQGQSWVTMVKGSLLSLPDEVKYWTSHNIVSYSTQWQNFKSLGAIETYSIQNAFGISYPLTLKKSNSTMHLASQSSMKMYWGFANDLMALSTNTSLMGLQSLVRTSGNYAFQNMSFESVLVQANYLSSPLTPELSILRSTIYGPFGSVDIKRVPCPISLLLLERSVTEIVESILSRNDVNTTAYAAISATMNYSPQTRTWSGHQLWGGSLLCEFGTQSGNQVVEFASAIEVCGTFTTNRVAATRRSQMKSILSANLLQSTAPNTADICTLETAQPAGCADSINKLRSFLAQYQPTSPQDLVAAAKADVGINLQVLITQYFKNGSNFQFSPVNLFDPMELNFEFFVWHLLFEWVQGFREVITVMGQYGNGTFLSGYVPPSQLTVDPLEIPLNVAYYIRCAILYVTCLLLLVGSLAACYILGVKGYVEMWNMFEINRVTGIVWIGRPLIFLRAITALCLLSTAKLDLVQSQNGLVSYFEAVPRPWYTTFNSCGEVTWLIYIINDVFSPATQQYTYFYSYKSSNLLWLITFIWSMLSPPLHQASISRTCDVDAVDFQIVCHSGIMQIGDSTRLFILIGLAFGSCGLCYVAERLIWPRTKPMHEHTSLFLHAVAKHNLEFPWQHRGVFYMDKASATLNGLLSLHIRHVVYIFDIKSWRFYTFDTADISVTTAHPALELAIPLVE
ncbi:hypothetical protein As57867_001265, partial [Aphanomyces stellatus]